MLPGREGWEGVPGEQHKKTERQLGLLWSCRAPLGRGRRGKSVDGSKGSAAGCEPTRVPSCPGHPVLVETKLQM